MFLTRLGLLACIANFFCLVFFISNSTPLFIMASIGVISIFMPDRPRLSWFTLVFVLYAGFLILMDWLYFINSSDFGSNRCLVLSFLSGIGVYYSFKESGVYWGGLLSIVLAASFFIVGALHYNTFIDDFFLNGCLRFVGRFHNSFGMVAALAALMGFVAFLRKYPPAAPTLLTPFFTVLYNKRVLAFTTVTCFVLLVLSSSRTCIYSCFAVSAGLVLLHTLKGAISVRKVVCLLLLIGALLLLIWQITPDNAYKKLVYDRVIVTAMEPWNAKTFKTRKPIWDVAITLAKENFALGVGPQRFQAEINAYVENNFEALAAEYDVHVLKGDTAVVAHPHNQFLTLLIEYGILGFLLFGFVFLYPVFYSVRNKTGFGALVPVLVYFFIASFLEAPFYSNTAGVGVAPSTVFYMCIGYFSCLHGLGRTQKAS